MRTLCTPQVLGSPQACLQHSRVSKASLRVVLQKKPPTLRSPLVSFAQVVASDVTEAPVNSQFSRPDDFSEQAGLDKTGSRKGTGNVAAQKEEALWRVMKRRSLFFCIASSCAGQFLGGTADADEPLPAPEDSQAQVSPLIQELLKKTEANKEKRRQERLYSYYKRNFKEYFQLEQSSPGLSSETREKIKEWLEKNE